MARRPPPASRDFRAKRQIPVTGEVDQRTLDRLPRDDPHSDERRVAQPDPEALSERPRRPLPDRPGAVHQQGVHRWSGWSTARLSSAMDVRFGSQKTPTREGVVHGGLEVPEPRLDDLRHADAVRDVLQRRPGRALLLGLRGPRLQRRLPRLRQRPGRRGSLRSSTRSGSATRSSSTGERSAPRRQDHRTGRGDRHGVLGVRAARAVGAAERPAVGSV